MKIKVTEIECNADELRQSNTLADSFSTLLRSCLNPMSGFSRPTEEDEDEDTPDGID